MDQWTLLLLPHSRKVPGLSAGLNPGLTFLMFSLCPCCVFSRNVSSHGPRTCMFRSIGQCQLDYVCWRCAPADPCYTIGHKVGKIRKNKSHLLSYLIVFFISLGPISCSTLQKLHIKSNKEFECMSWHRDTVSSVLKVFSSLLFSSSLITTHTDMKMLYKCYRKCISYEPQELSTSVVN